MMGESSSWNTSTPVLRPSRPSAQAQDDGLEGVPGLEEGLRLGFEYFGSKAMP